MRKGSESRAGRVSCARGAAPRPAHPAAPTNATAPASPPAAGAPSAVAPASPSGFFLRRRRRRSILPIGREPPRWLRLAFGGFAFGAGRLRRSRPCRSRRHRRPLGFGGSFRCLLRWRLRSTGRRRWQRGARRPTEGRHSSWASPRHSADPTVPTQRWGRLRPLRRSPGWFSFSVVMVWFGWCGGGTLALDLGVWGCPQKTRRAAGAARDACETSSRLARAAEPTMPQRSVPWGRAFSANDSWLRGFQREIGRWRFLPPLRSMVRVSPPCSLLRALTRPASARDLAERLRDRAVRGRLPTGVPASPHSEWKRRSGSGRARVLRRIQRSLCRRPAEKLVAFSQPSR